MERGNIFMGVMVAAVIFLSVTLYLGVTERPQVAQGNWSVAIGNISSDFRSDMYVDPGGNFYTVAGDSIYAIGSDGSTKWTVPFSDDWLENQTDFYLCAADYQGNTLYMVIGSEPKKVYHERSLLMAISDSGKILWATPVEGVYNMQMSVTGECIYLHYYPDTLSVYDTGGRLVWSKSNIYFPFATGSDGILYLTNSSDPFESSPYNIPTAELEAYYPNGTLYWRHNITDFGGNIKLTYIVQGITRLLYNDGVIYIMGSQQLIAVDEDGTPRWVKDYGQMLDLIGFDGSGRVYLQADDYRNDTMNSIVIARDGSESISPIRDISYINYTLSGFSDGIGYYVTRYNFANTGQGHLKNFTVKACDMATGHLLWSYTITPMHVRNVKLNSSNVADILFDWGDLGEARQVNGIAPWVWYDSKGLPPGWHITRSQFLTNLVASSPAVYFSYWAYGYEYPAFYDMANCTYAGGLYAIDRNGKLLWYRDTDSYITSMTARNGTIYYQMNGGRFSAAGADITAGFAAAAIYLFFRFLVLGAVSRARSRLDKNANRNAVLAYVADNPGVSLYDIIRGLRLNVGTVRYHLLILSINHKVTASGKSPKSIGYFAGNRQYSGEEKLLMSLVRREQIKKLLLCLTDRPGLSNAEIARELGLAESAVSRHMIELYRKGVVTKRRTESGKLTYCIEERYLPAMSCLAADSQVSYAGGQGLRESLLAEASK